MKPSTTPAGPAWQDRAAMARFFNTAGPRRPAVFEELGLRIAFGFPSPRGALFFLTDPTSLEQPPVVLPLSALFRHSDGSRTFHRTSLGTLTWACAGPLALCCSFACSSEQATDDLASPAGGSSFAVAGGQPNGTGGALIEVNRDGSGDFTTVQAAFNSVATSNTTPTIVRIAPGQR